MKTSWIGASLIAFSDRVRIVGSGSCDRLEIVAHGRIERDLVVVRHALAAGEKALGESARLIVEVPIPGLHEGEVVGDVESGCVDVAEIGDWGGEILRRREVEFARLLERVQEIGAGDGEARSPWPWRPARDKIGAEVGGVERRAYAADHRSAGLA